MATFTTTWGARITSPADALQLLSQFSTKTMPAGVEVGPPRLLLSSRTADRRWRRRGNWPPRREAVRETLTSSKEPS